MHSLFFAARLAGVGFASLIATSFPAATQDRNVARCLSITDVNERIDCLESGGAAPNSVTSPTPNVRSPKQLHAGPSFDCRAANSSIERAICADVTLSEWDLRMGQQYQHALRSRKDGDTQPVMENQRAWLLQRNSRCGVVADTAIWACLLDMTKQRVDALTKLAAVGTETVPTAQSQTPIQTAPKNPTGPVLSTPSTNSGSPSTSAISKSDVSSNPPSEGPNPLLVVLFVLGAAIGAIAIFGNISRQKRLAAERQRLAEERQRLVTKYGEEAADRILARQVWQGMTDEQLIESWGIPADKDTEIKRTTRKETWKYGQIGKNRFSNRVFLENGIVIGWKN
jgi:uncharacterized protein YecT (DUF1311 family)